MRRSMIQSMVKVCLANSAPSRGRLDVDDSRNHRVHSVSASMGAARTHLLHPQVFEESARARRTDRERATAQPDMAQVDEYVEAVKSGLS